MDNQDIMMTDLACNILKNDENLEKREHLIKICEAMGQCPVCNQNISNILFHLETQHSRDEPSRDLILGKIKEKLIEMKTAMSKFFLLKAAYTHHTAADPHKTDYLNVINSLLDDLEMALNFTKNYK